jgi:soluble lytic murein transglycosylase-like protein
MLFVLLLASVAGFIDFDSSIDRAFTAVQNNEWKTAAEALDEALAEDAAKFEANNFHYLRGRVAENEKDWGRARDEFKKVTPDNPLYMMALWHAARVSARLGDDAATEALVDQLPRNFPADLKMQIAAESTPPIAFKIYAALSTREARFQRALLLGDTNVFWSLLREKKDDDVGLESARLAAVGAVVPRDHMDVAQTFAEHRQFEEAIPLYRKASEDPIYAAEARFQIARSHFLNENYRPALETYQGIVKDFAGKSWEEEAEYQIASCYWRLGEYRNAEKAYLSYINKYGNAGNEEGAIRNLIDVYRILGENQKAVTWLDKTLARRLSVPTRQVLLFTKAKVLYSDKRYSAALQIFRELGRLRLRSAAGGTTAEEIQYFQAMSLSKMGNKAGAETIWRRLAQDELSYYGQQSAEKLGRMPIKNPAVCETASSAAQAIEKDLVNVARPLRAAMDRTADAVSELMFLRLWDEASFWNEQAGNRLATRPAAQLAYMGGRYHRTIAYANRLPKNSSTLPLLYPAGFRSLICAAAAKHDVDPLWLHSIIWQESKYNPLARSGAAARGLMQFIPQTATTIASSIGMPSLSVDMLYDPAVIIELGARYWSLLMDEWKNPEMALAAYNGGPDNVRRWKNKWPDAPEDSELFVADIGFIETKRYVMAVFGARAAYGALQ